MTQNKISSRKIDKTRLLVSDNNGSIQTILNRHGSINPYTIVLDQDCSENLTIPANVTIEAAGGKLSGTVTINGFIQDTMLQIFDGATLTLGGLISEVKPEWWGSITYGTTNATPLVQAANNAVSSNGGTVMFRKNRIYMFEHSGSTLTIPTLAATRYCVKISSNVEINLNGATVKLADNNYSVPFINDGLAAGGNVNIKLHNGVIDENKANNAVSKVTYTGEQAAFIFHNVEGLCLDNIKAINIQEYASRVFNVQNGYFDNLFCTDSNGSGWSFGLASPLTVDDSHFGKIRADNCTNSYSFAGAIGNGFIFTGNNCDMNTIELRSCEQGFKIQGISNNVLIDKIIVHNDGNQGCKLQGNSLAAPVTNIKINQILTSGCKGTGFYGEFFSNCQIGSIKSIADSTTAASASVWVGSGTENQIDNIYCEYAGNIGVYVRSDSSYCQIGKINVKNSGQVTSGSVNINISGDYTQIGEIISRDTQTGSETVGNGLQIASTASNVELGKCIFEGAFTESSKQIKNDSSLEISVDDVIVDGSRIYNLAVGATSLGLPANNMCKIFRTNNTAPTTITSFGLRIPNAERILLINDAFTTIDFSGTNLVRVGNAGVDWSPGAGDYIKARSNGTDWLCEIYEL